MAVERNGAHVIVLGNEKGGSGKSTTAIHLAIQLLAEGHSVATIDADSRQQTLTTYIRNRRQWAQSHDMRLVHPVHYHLPRAQDDSASRNMRSEFDMFRSVVADAEHNVDFLIIDTPGFDTHLTRLAHALADSLVTPLNDSLIDLHVLARMDPEHGKVLELNHYARLVQRARRERLAIDGRTIDWVLVRNRISMLNSRNGALVQTGVEQIAGRVGARVADGIAERVAFRSLFSVGLTVFDPVDDDHTGGASATSRESARREYRMLMDALKLPDPNHRRNDARLQSDSFAI